MNTCAPGDDSSSKGRRSLREWILRLFLMLLAIAVAQFGVTLFILPALGSDPYTIFSQGFSRVLGTSVGTTHMMFAVFFMVVMLLTTKGYVLPGTVVCSFFAGPFMDLYLSLLDGLVRPDSPMTIRFVTVAAGCVITGIGLSLLIKAHAGLGANDLISVILADKIPGLQFRWARVGCDFAYSVIGYLLGGVLGVSSVMSILLIGPIAQQFFPVMDRLVAWVVRPPMPIEKNAPAE